MECKLSEKRRTLFVVTIVVGIGVDDNSVTHWNRQVSVHLDTVGMSTFTYKEHMSIFHSDTAVRSDSTHWRIEIIADHSRQQRDADSSTGTRHPS